MSQDLPDFVALEQYYRESLSSGDRALLKRAAGLEDIALCPGLYRLFPGQRPGNPHLRVAFLLPHCTHDPKAPSLGTRLAEKKISEKRVLQIARAESPVDLEQLRRLLKHIKSAVDWNEFGRAIWFWGERSKRQIVEDFYIAQFTPQKKEPSNV